jgi:DNA-binding beta-propeller fold protein YncE
MALTSPLTDLRAFASAIAVAIVLLLPGCGAGSGDPSGAIAFVAEWGGRGSADGLFAGGPRCVTVAPDGSVYTIDKGGRIQKFSQDGKFLLAWWPPDVSAGRPQDIESDGAGNLFVADTHYDQVLKYSLEGNLLARWGTTGDQPGQFVYPVGVAVDSGGAVYVAEYGKKHRIQKFDNGGKFLLEWGSFGTEDGQFNRPQDLAIAPNGEIYVVDSCNHRVQVFKGDGTFLRKLGGPGVGIGEFRYPFGIAFVNAETFVIVEYGKCRLQTFRDDRAVAEYGRAGTGPFEFNSPWDIALARAGDLYVADTQNFRIQKLKVRF